jgi:phospholipase C
MSDANRRDFLKLAAGTAATMAMLPGLIERAMAIPAHNATGSIKDVEHIVVFMQENRSFDHYFGMLSGVRGFGDPRPARIPGGRSIWAQPSTEHPDGYVLPYLGDSKATQSFTVDGSAQNHQANLTIFNAGRCDGWGATRELHKRMLHYGPSDLPFYYALANAFTICDAYHCSTLTQTYPNRLHLFSGCNGGGMVGGDPEMTNYGEDETPSADMATDKPLRPGAFGWTTYAERLQDAGVSWKVYQEYDNYGDNLLSIFPAFRPCDRDSDLYRRGRSWVSEHKAGADRTRSDGEQLVEAFRADLAAGTLPQISWIVTAEDLSEHPEAEPSRGEHVAAKLIEALVDHPETFARTVFIVNYDESGGFYDHMPSPVPPLDAARGLSTVPVDGEAKIYAAPAAADKKPEVAHAGKQPIGLGIRVPAIIVSPWSRGGFVCSELFDHTSVLQFMEQRFGVREPNISAWRRSVCGDLTSTLDFANPNRDWSTLTLPGTDDFLDRIARSKAGVANAIPTVQQPTAQMPGRRRSRPLPYDLDITGRVTPEKRFCLTMVNRGRAGAALAVYDNSDAHAPWHYTVGAGDRLESEQWHEVAPDLADYDLTVAGPDGLHQRYAGTLAAAVPDVSLVRLPRDEAVELLFKNSGGTPLLFEVRFDGAYPSGSEPARQVRVAPGTSARERWRLAKDDHWYDLSVRWARDPKFLRRFAGRLDASRPGLTDPAIGTMRL